LLLINRCITLSHLIHLVPSHLCVRSERPESPEPHPAKWSSSLDFTHDPPPLDLARGASRISSLGIGGRPALGAFRSASEAGRGDPVSHAAPLPFGQASATPHATPRQRTTAKTAARSFPRPRAHAQLAVLESLLAAPPTTGQGRAACSRQWPAGARGCCGGRRRSRCPGRYLDGSRMHARPHAHDVYRV